MVAEPFKSTTISQASVGLFSFLPRAASISGEGFTLTYHSPPSWNRPRSRAMELAERYCIVGASLAYCQLLIQASTVRRSLGAPQKETVA